MSVPEAAVDPRSHRETRLHTVRLLADRRSNHRQRALWEGGEPEGPAQRDARICTHWPDRGAEQIQTAARSLHALSDHSPWDDVLVLPPAGQAGCIDLERLADEPVSGDALQQLATHSAQVQAQKRVLQSLSDDFARVSAWLTDAAGSSWSAAERLRQQAGLSVAAGDSRRLMSKDSLSADVNALVCAMLRRAVYLLERLDLATGAVRADAAGQQAFGLLLPQAAVLLDNAAVLLADAVVFVAEFDRRWRQIRRQVARAVALTAQPVVSFGAEP